MAHVIGSISHILPQRASHGVRSDLHWHLRPQMVYKILQDRDDRTQVSLVFANTTEKDIILKEELDGLAKAHDNFHVWWGLSPQTVIDKFPAS